MKNCTCLILAGGLGTRLLPVISDRPKVLAEVNGRPFVSYLLDQLSLAGCRKAVFCTGYLGESIQKHFGPRYKNMTLLYSRERRPMGTGGGLRLALKFVKTRSVLVMNGDSFCEASLFDFYSKFKKKKMEAAILLTRVLDARRFGRVVLDPQDKILRFLEKDPKKSAGWINAGVYFMTRERLKSIAAGRPVSLEKEIFPQWISQGLYGHRVRARLVDIGTVESYNMAGRFLP